MVGNLEFQNIDLEFDKHNARHIVNIKSCKPKLGKQLGNIKRKSDFKTTQSQRTSNSNLVVVSINGCCYGIDNHPDKGD